MAEGANALMAIKAVSAKLTRVRLRRFVVDVDVAVDFAVAL